MKTEIDTRYWSSILYIQYKSWCLTAAQSKDKWRTSITFQLQSTDWEEWVARVISEQTRHSLSYIWCYQASQTQTMDIQTREGQIAMLLTKQESVTLLDSTNKHPLVSKMYLFIYILMMDWL